MLLESLENRRMMAFSVISASQSGGTLVINGGTSCATTGGSHHNTGGSGHILAALRTTYTNYITQAKAAHSGGSHAGGSGGSGQCVGTDDRIEVTEDPQSPGTFTVRDTFNNEEMTYRNVTKLTVNLGGGNDTLLYQGITLDATLNGGKGADYISVEDAGTSNTTVNGDDDNDVITLVHANKTFVDAGAGNDTIYINTGFNVDPTEYNYASAEATVKAGNGDDQIWVYAGKSTINGQGGNDDVYIDGGTATVSSATVHYV